uniref:Family with sequence similarity 13 member C n=1 Tax=Cyprinus carpio TaxID=7962 RepID=A0A8C1J312_CYPCA
QVHFNSLTPQNTIETTQKHNNSHSEHLRSATVEHTAFIPVQDSDLCVCVCVCSDCRLAEGDCSSDLQQIPGPSRLIQHITDDNSPLPSPRCSSLSQSQRFNTDPESAPSPPCAQHLIMARGVVRTEVSGDAMEATSIPNLTKHIQTLKRKIRKFEERFEQEMKYKPSHNDKSANPEIFKLMSELARSRKQLKDLKLRLSFEESQKHENNQSTDVCRYTNGQQETPEQPHKPSLEETVDTVLKRLREKRQALGLPDNMKVRPSAEAFCSGGWGFDCVLVRPGFAVINSTRALVSTGDDPKTDGPGEDHSAKMSAVF